jgi:MFS family permease
LNTDPRETLSTAPMSRLQILAVAVTVGLTALDGFDVLSISFASPGIATEWGIDRAALGIVLSMELMGMAIGSIILGGLADRIGRRPTMLGCLVVMSAGMFLVTTSNAVAAEFSNLRRRNLGVSLMAIGYPIGAVAGGLIVAQLLHAHAWRSVFYFGGSITALFVPLVLLLPESVHWLTQKQPAGALAKVNSALRRMGHEIVAALPVISPETGPRSASGIFAPALIGTTILAALAYFFHIMTFYFILKWIPKIVVDMHFAPAAAASVLVWANVGGALGGLTIGFLTQRVGLKPATIGVMLLSTVMVIVFGRSAPDLHELSLLSAGAGFFTNAAIVGLYAIYAQAFPTRVRATGTGFAIGIGRGGSVLGPIMAGFLFKWGYGLPQVALYMAMGSLLAAGILSLLKLKPDQPTPVTLLSGTSS